MRRVKFIKELGRRQGQGAGPEYKAGDSHVFSGYVAETYAQAYIDRGYAVDAPQPIVTTSVPAPGVRLSKLDVVVPVTEELLTHKVASQKPLPQIPTAVATAAPMLGGKVKPR